MRWPLLKRLGAALLLRQGVKELTGIRLHLAEQNVLLRRLADHLAPQLPAGAVESADTGVSYLDAIEGGQVLDYIAKTERDLGRAPTEEEILSYLADERTVDLHERLRREDRR